MIRDPTTVDAENWGSCSLLFPSDIHTPISHTVKVIELFKYFNSTFYLT